jgi:dimethylhistidine N-methyltransferase
LSKNYQARASFKQTAGEMNKPESKVTQSHADAGVRIINQLHANRERERTLLIAGLLASPAHIEPKYFYDELGCTLYAAICQLDEYYPTRTERAIFEQYRREISTKITEHGGCGTFVDLGAGDCAKAMSWLPFVQPKRYLAVDIAGPSMEAALANMATEFPETEMVGLVTDFSRELLIPAHLLHERTTLFYPGSSIGNFTPANATQFLAQMRRHTIDGGLLIGVDAKKDKRRLDAAYADALGVTAAFNLNALRHINRLLGADFDESQWHHVGTYNEQFGRVEMYLESAVDQEVMIGGKARRFAKGERIHSENSYKYTQTEFDALLREAGFSDISVWTDREQAFWVFYAR